MSNAGPDPGRTEDGLPPRGAADADLHPPGGGGEGSGNRGAAGGGRALVMALVAAAVVVVAAGGYWLFREASTSGGSPTVVVDLPRSDDEDGAGEGSAGSTAMSGSSGGVEDDAAVQVEPAGGQTVAMVPAPQPALVEQGKYGPLPIVGADGRQPWQAYARPVDGDIALPRVAVVITEIGLESAASEAAIERLPGPVTLAIDPYAAAADEWARRARDAGHEILLSLPLEASEFPFRDPGPMALLTELPAEDNMDRLQLALSRCTGYVGVLSQFGQRFEQNRESLEPVLSAIAKRGLMYVDGVRTGDGLLVEIAEEMGVPHVSADVWVDDEPTGESIDSALARLQAMAQERNAAVGIGRAYPLTIERVRRWAEAIQGGEIALVPVSAVVDGRISPSP